MSSITSVLDRPILGAGTYPRRTSALARLRARVTWAHLALALVLVGTAVAYLWNLSASGNGNSFYAAAVQAGTKSWKAFFFGSLDSSNFITVDKPPASLWVMALSGRIFGFSSWSMLVPQALEGVAAVALLYAAVKRWFGTVPGLAAGAMFAMTPVAALMFRFNNPDALLVLLLVAGAYCLTRALEKAQTKWVVAAGTMIGFAFLAKMLQAFIVLPAFATVYMYAAPTGLGRRIRQTLAGGAAVIVSAGWWVAIVALWPAGSRPFIDGSPDNNIFNLITGYNGLQRLFSGGGPGGGGGSNFSGSTGVFRLFNDLMGGQASWLLPAALLALVVGLWARRRTPRTDRTRAALLLWGGWLIVTAIVFSFSSGVIHTYYTVALAPAIAALVAIGAALLWSHRHEWPASVAAAVAVGGTGAWAYLLLGRTPSWEPWLRGVILVSTILAVIGLLAASVLGRVSRHGAVTIVALAVVASVSGPLAYAADTITTSQNGSVVSAGPATASGFGGPGGGSAFGTRSRAGAFGGGFPGARSSGGFPGGNAPGGTATSGGGGAPGGGGTTSKALVDALKSDASRYRWVAATSGSQSAATLELSTGGEPVMAIGGFNNNGGNLTLSAFEQYVKKGEIHYYIAGGGAPGGGGGAPSGAPGSTLGAPSGAPGSTLGAPSGAPGSTLGAPSGAPGGSGRAGTIPGAPGGSGSAGTIPGGPPSALGGAFGDFRGGAPGGGVPGGRSGSTSQISSWVESHFKAVTTGSETVYDLSQPNVAS